MPDLVADPVGERGLVRLRPNAGRSSGVTCPVETSTTSHAVLARSVRAIATASSALEPAGHPVGRRDPHAHRLLRRPHRAARVEHLEREPQPALERAAVLVGRGGWSAARGSATAGSRARSAARAGRSRPRAALGGGDELVADRVHVRAGQLARDLVAGRSTGSGDGRDDRPVARVAAARRCPPTSAWSSPCGRSGRAAAPIARRAVRVHEVDDPLPGRRLLVVYSPAQPGVIRPPATRRPSRSSPARRRRAPARRGGRGGSRPAARRPRSTCPSATRSRGCAAPARAAGTAGTSAGGPPAVPSPAGAEGRVDARRTPGRAAAGCRR